MDGIRPRGAASMSHSPSRRNSVPPTKPLDCATAAPRAHSNKCSIAAPSAGAAMAETEKPARTDAAILKEARERLEQCVNANAEQRKLQLLDLKFATLDQWPPEIRASREDPSQPGGPRPCLTLDNIHQY